MLDLKFAEVYLRLVAWFGLKAHIGHGLTLILDSTDPAFDDFVAAVKPHAPQPVIDPGSAVAAIFVEPGFNVIGKRIEFAFALAGCHRGKRQVRVFEISINGGAADAQLACDGTPAQPIVFKAKNVQNGLLFFIISHSVNLRVKLELYRFYPEEEIGD